MSAECLDIPHVMTRVVCRGGETPALIFFGAKVAEQWRAREVRGNIGVSEAVSAPSNYYFYLVPRPTMLQHCPC